MAMKENINVIVKLIFVLNNVIFIVIFSIEK